MKIGWRDVAAAIFAVFGATIVFAKLQSFSWWLIGSWKGALGVLAVTGLAILVTYWSDFVESTQLAIAAIMLLWLSAATVAVASLFATTTKAEFAWTAGLIGVTWLSQLATHAWETLHHGHGSHAVPVH